LTPARRIAKLHPISHAKLKEDAMSKPIAAALRRVAVRAA
jgi:hypothetical protein